MAKKEDTLQQRKDELETLLTTMEKCGFRDLPRMIRELITAIEQKLQEEL